MRERQFYLVLPAFVRRSPGHGWVRPGRCYEGRVLSGVVPAAPGWVRLLHPTQPGITVLVPRTCVAEVPREECDE